MWSGAGAGEDDPHIPGRPGNLLHIIDKIVSAVGRRVDESSPMVDARLPEIPRECRSSLVAVDGPILSIRSLCRIT